MCNYHCKKCNMYFLDIKLYFSHCLKCSKPTIYQCPFPNCNRQYSSKWSFKTHIKQHKKWKLQYDLNITTINDNLDSNLNLEELISLFKKGLNLRLPFKLYSEKSLPKNKTFRILEEINTHYCQIFLTVKSILSQRMYVLLKWIFFTTLFAKQMFRLNIIFIYENFG